MSRLFIGNIDYRNTEEDLRAVMEGAGVSVSDLQVIRDSATCASKGYAFADLAGEHDLDEVINKLRGATLSGRALNFKPAIPRRY